MAQKSATGVYAIINRKNGKRYVGSAARSFAERWSKHRHHLRTNMHHSSHLQRAWNRNGEDAFDFVVLEQCAPAQCVAREQHYIDLHASWKRSMGYNMSPTAGSVLGIKLSDEAKKRMSIRATGRKFSDSFKKMRSDIMKAKWADKNERVRMSAAIIASKTPEVYKRISETRLARGFKHTPEAIAKIAAASRALSTEKRAEMVRLSKASGVHERQAAKLRGKYMPRETVEKMRASKLGVPKSEEHKAATAAAIKEWHRKRRRINEWFDAHVGMRPNQIDWEVAA